MNRKVDLSISCYGEVKDGRYDIVALPWGATEPHNLHLPYMTDCILSHDVAVSAALIAKQKYGVNCMVMPPIGMGSQNPGQRELPFCIHTRYETQKAILTDIVSSLYVQGIRKLVIINGHGGNTFKSMIRDLSVDYPDFLIASSEWYTVLKVKDYFENPGDHADEVETSVSGEYKTFAVQSLNEKVAWIPRNWGKVSKDTGVGDPRGASAEKGKKFAEAVAEKYARLFDELVNQKLY